MTRAGPAYITRSTNHNILWSRLENHKKRRARAEVQEVGTETASIWQISAVYAGFELTEATRKFRKLARKLARLVAAGIGPDAVENAEIDGGS